MKVFTVSHKGMRTLGDQAPELLKQTSYVPLFHHNLSEHNFLFIFLFKKNTYLFIWLRWVLATSRAFLWYLVGHELSSCGVQT